MLNNGKIIKWLGLTPMKRPEITVALVPDAHKPKKIVYGRGDLDFDTLATRQVGKRADINSLNIVMTHPNIPR